MNLWIRTGCFLTGWNHHILESCSEASYKHLKKYTAALLILIILWAFTGYCFADRYVQAPWWGCAISSFIFVVVVIQIERQIILTVGSTRGIAWFRVFIAVIMSLIGSSIIDQIIFAKDIDKKMIEIRERQVDSLFPKRRALLDDKSKMIQVTIDSLDRMNQRLNEEITKNPVITTVITEDEFIKVIGSNGKDSIVKRTKVIKTTIPNPKIKQFEANNTTLKEYIEDRKEVEDKKKEAKDDLRKELGEKTGFLEELNAMLEIIGDRLEALIFYLVIFCFLVALELFVVISKAGDKKCDYDLIVEHQLETKQKTLEQLKI